MAFTDKFQMNLPLKVFTVNFGVGIDVFGSSSLKIKSIFKYKMVCKILDLIMDYFFAESENYKDLKVIMHFLLIACKYKFSRSIMNYKVFRKTFYSVQNIISANAKVNWSKQVDGQNNTISINITWLKLMLQSISTIYQEQ